MPKRYLAKIMFLTLLAQIARLNTGPHGLGNPDAPLKKKSRVTYLANKPVIG
jgi:hypothetical protein